MLKKTLGSFLPDVLIFIIKQYQYPRLVVEMTSVHIYLNDIETLYDTKIELVNDDDVIGICALSSGYLETFHYKKMVDKLQHLQKPSAHMFFCVLTPPYAQVSYFGCYFHGGSASNRHIAIPYMLLHNTSEIINMPSPFRNYNIPHTYATAEKSLISITCIANTNVQRIEIKSHDPDHNSWNVEAVITEKFYKKSNMDVLGLCGNEHWFVVMQKTRLLLFDRTMQTFYTILYKKPCCCINQRFPIIWDNIVYLIGCSGNTSFVIDAIKFDLKSLLQINECYNCKENNQKIIKNIIIH